jgi:NTP pyrophosphatase (non-canonical NTP hydrolase)
MEATMTDINRLFEACQDYQEKIVLYPIHPREQQAAKLLFCINDEVHEVAKLIQWKDWKPPKDITVKDLKNITYEIADIIFFIVELCTVLGITADELVQAFFNKLELNKARHTQ